MCLNCIYVYVCVYSYLRIYLLHKQVLVVSSKNGPQRSNDDQETSQGKVDYSNRKNSESAPAKNAPGQRKAAYYNKARKPVGILAALNPDHSHFILVSRYVSMICTRVYICM